MSAGGRTYAFPRWPVAVLGAAVLVLVVLALALGPEALAAGWLFCLGVCVGAAAWLMIHTVIGGRWRGCRCWLCCRSFIRGDRSETRREARFT